MVRQAIAGLGVILGLSLACPAKAEVTNQVTQTITANGDGATTNYTISFYFQANSQLKVQKVDTSTSPSTVTTIVQGSGSSKYTVTGGNPGTTVVMGTAPTSSQYLVITRNLPITQTVTYDESAAFPVTDHEAQMDYMTMILQGINASQSKNIALAPTSQASPTPVMPDPVADSLMEYNHSSTFSLLTPSSDQSIPVYTAGAGWSFGAFTGSHIASLLTGASTVWAPGNGGTGVANSTNLTWSAHALTFTLSGDTNVTLPSGSSSLLLNPMSGPGDLIYGGTGGAATALSGSTSATKKYLAETGTGSAGQAPVWSQPAFSELSGSATLAQLPSIANNSLLGNISGSSAVPSPVPLAPVPAGSPTPTPSTIANIDSNGNTAANVVVQAQASHATAASTTTLTVSSPAVQRFTGSTTQEMDLPTGSTLANGWTYHVTNTSTGAVTIKNSAASTICTMTPAAGESEEATVTLQDNTGNGTWSCSLAYSGLLPVVNGGTGLATLTNHALQVGAATATPTQLGPSASTGLPLVSQGASSDPSFAALGIGGGGTGVTSATTVPAASTFAAWDANKNLTANLFVTGFATTATAASTTTLTVGSKQSQFFTGSTTQTVVLPATSTLQQGTTYTITNLSSGNVTVQSNGSNTIQVMGQNSQLTVTNLVTNADTAAAWSPIYASSSPATVTSVAVAVGAGGMAVSGSPVTSSGTITLTPKGPTVQIFTANTLTTTGNLTSSNVCIASPGSTAGLTAGMPISDTTNSGHLGANTTVVALPGSCSAGQIQMSVAANNTATGDTFIFGKVYTLPTSPSPLYLRVRVMGAGGGGSGGGTAGGVGGAGGTSQFGSALMFGNGGAGGVWAGGTAAGGTASIGSGPIGRAFQGGAGNSGFGGSATSLNEAGQPGCSSPFAGQGAGTTGTTTGVAAIPNTGSGGGGGGGGTSAEGGGGGACGGYAEAMILSPSATYPVLLGAAGGGGTSTGGGVGGAGSDGIVWVEEFYQ